MSKIMGPPGAVSTSGAPQGAPAPDRPASELPSAAFTPGPWTAHQGWADPWIDLDIRRHPDWCEVTGPEGPPHLSISGHFGIANARLIATAPDLYAALAKIKALTEPGQELGVSAAVDLICDVWNEARAAVAKATGQ